MHTAFILPDLGGGGAERLTVDLIQGFVDRGARVDLVLMQARGEFLSLVPRGVRVIDLAAPRLRQAFGPLRRYFRQERPDCALASMWPLSTVAIGAAMGLARRPRIAVVDHCPLAEQYGDQPGTLVALRTTIRALYRRADAVIGVSRGVADEIAGMAGMKRNQVAAIFNPVPYPLRSQTSIDAPWQGHDGKRILAVGRLTAAKNFRLLIDAFAALPQTVDARLAIVGEGELRAELEAQIAQLGLCGKVILPGFVATPGDWYVGANLLALTSDYEGFGNVLVEAMHCGLTIVATDCPGGVGEVLGNGKWGTLVPCKDPVALSAAIEQALAAPADPDVQRARAREFSVDLAVEAYWQALSPA